MALGAKTGASRSLTDVIEREWSLALPNPMPLSTLGPYCQLKAVTVSYPAKLNGTAASIDTKAASVVAHLPLPMKPSASKRGSSSSSKQLPPPPPIAPSNAVLASVTLDIERNSKIGIIGSNGCGKSTLFRLIYEYGETTGDSSENASPVVIDGSLSKSNNLRIAFYQQHLQDVLPYEMTPLQYLLTYCTQYQSSLERPLVDGNAASFNEQSIRAHLGSFGLGGDLALRQIGVLSGGQKARVVLAQLTLSRPHVLLLDEPTNNLDIDGIRALSVALQNYQGAILIASHDMAFISASCNVVYTIDTKEKRLKLLEGGCEEYVENIRKGVEKKRSQANNNNR